MKNQSSLEFATTYAWALVVILVVIVALIFYSEVDTTSGMVENCRLGPQFYCQDVVVDSYGQFNLKFVNNINDKIIVSELIFDDLIVECPSLPISVRRGHSTEIQCNINDLLQAKEEETFSFDLNFTTEDSNTSFVSKAKVTTKIVEEIEDFTVDCDFDGDSYDKYGCGNDNDCNDEDPGLWFSACRQDIDCGDPARYTCLNPSACDASCFDTCDRDGDSHLSYACGGNDCNDEDETQWRSLCRSDSDCRTGDRCKHATQCDAVCVPYIAIG